MSKIISCILIPVAVGVRYHNPHTTVYWSDNSQTTVTAHNEQFDKEKGLAMAYMRRIYGSRRQFLRVIDRSVDDSAIARGLLKSLRCSRCNGNNLVSEKYIHDNKITIRCDDCGSTICKIDSDSF